MPAKDFLKSILTIPKRLYHWVADRAERPHASRTLFFISFAEASFFPIPPDVLLIPLCMGAHRRWWKFALNCSVGSILGGVAGFLIGQYAFDLIGSKLIDLTAAISSHNSQELLETARYWFNEKELAGFLIGPWAVGMAGFTPIPFKVFTIAAGFFDMAFLPFVIASTISRSLRFFIVAGIISIGYEKYGDRLKLFIDKYFNWLAIAFVILLIGGFRLIGILF